MSGLGLGLWMGLGGQGGMRKIAAITRSILSQYAQTGTTEITIKRNVSTKDLIAIIPQVSPTISTGTKPLKFTNYTDNVRTLIDIQANENGNDTELLAWLIDELYTNDVNVWLNLQSVGVARDNIHVSGELPAVFNVNNAQGDNYIRLNVSEPTTITATDGASISFNGTDWASGEIELNPVETYHAIYFKGVSGTLTIQKRKYVTYLYLWNTGSSITGDITGMALNYLRVDNTGSSIVGNITGMALNYLFIWGVDIGSITGNITGMALTYLYLWNTGSSITGDITGMALTLLYLYNIGSSLNYGQNPLLNITNSSGIQLLGDTIFTAEEYIRLFADAANCVANNRWTASTKKFTISGGDNPGWSNVSGYCDTLVGGGVTVTVPLAWESGDDAFPPETQNS